MLWSQGFHFQTYCLGERLIQYASEYLVTEVLISPQLNTLQQCMKNMLGSFTKHRHILHGGYTFAGTGAWVLQVKYSYQDYKNIENGNWFLIKLKILRNTFSFTVGWILYLLKLYKIVWRLWHPTCNEGLRKQHHN